MDIFELKFSNMELIGFSFMAIVILFALLGLRKFIPMLIKNPDKEKDFRRYFTMVEIMIWIVFTVFVIQQMSDSNQIYAFGLFLLLMMAGFWTLWFYFKNYISGSIFKLNDKFDINDMVKINDYQGKIVGLGNHRLELESDNGEIIYLPYSMLSDAVIVKLHPGEMVLNHSFTLSTPHDKRSKDKKEEIRFAILSLPWSSLKKSPIIKLIHNDKDQLVFEILLYTIEKEYFFKMEQEIRERFGFPKNENPSVS